MGTTPNLKLPYPELTETADGPDAFSDLATATESYFYNRTLPSGIVRSPSYFWGAGTAFPSSGAVAGDTYRHTGLGCLMTYTGASWRQAEPGVVASRAARDAIVTTYSAILHDGFMVTQSDKGYEWTWLGGAWRFGRRNGEHPWVAWSTTAAITAWPGGQVFGGAPAVNTYDSALFTFTAGSDASNGSRVTVRDEGRYRISVQWGLEYQPSGNTYYGSVAIRFTPAPIAGTKSDWLALRSASTSPNSQFMDFYASDDFWLPANQDIRVDVASNPSAGLAIRAASRIAVQRIG